MSEIDHPEIRHVIPPTRLDGTPIGSNPRMRHLPDCGHFEWGDGTILGTPVLATEEQMRRLPACKDCVERKDGGHSSRARPPAGRVGEPCPTCNMALPLTGVCDNCG